MQNEVLFLISFNSFFLLILMNFLPREKCLKLLSKHGLPENIVRHSLAVEKEIFSKIGAGTGLEGL